MNALRLVAIFFQTDLKIYRKYPSRILFSIFQILTMIFLFYYISETLGEIAILNTKYFPFVASGLAFQYFFAGIVHSSSEKLEEYRDYGVLEELLFSRFPPWMVILCAGFQEMFISLCKSLIIILGVAFVFDFSIHPWLLMMTLFLAFILAIELSFVASCSFLLWKRFSLLEIGGSVITLFLSGIYFPVDVLPSALEKLAQSNPLLHAIGLFRMSLGFKNSGLVVDNVTISFGLIVAMTALLAAGNVVIYKLALKKIKNQGLSNHF